MLILISTPIGNLGDFSVRARQAFAEADIIACEDTRQTRKLCTLLGLEIRAKFISYHDHNAAQQRPILLGALHQNQTIVLVSDAGTPLICDPGYQLVRACHDHQIAVTAIPGACAPIMALTLSGLPSDRFMFQGFVPKKPNQARTQISQSASLPITQIWFETASRLAATLKIMHEIYGDRQAVIARELTKLHEQIDRDYLSHLAQKYHNHPAPKGEITLIIEGAPSQKSDFDEQSIRTLLKDTLSTTTLKQAVSDVHEITAWPKRTLYKLALELKS